MVFNNLFLQIILYLIKCIQYRLNRFNYTFKVYLIQINIIHLIKYYLIKCIILIELNITFLGLFLLIFISY